MGLNKALARMGYGTLRFTPYKFSLKVLPFEFKLPPGQGQCVQRRTLTEFRTVEAAGSPQGLVYHRMRVGFDPRVKPRSGKKARQLRMAAVPARLAHKHLPGSSPSRTGPQAPSHRDNTGAWTRVSSQPPELLTRAAISPWHQRSEARDGGVEHGPQKPDRKDPGCLR